MKRTTAAVVLLAALFLSLVIVLFARSGSRVELPRPAPAFDLEGSDGGRVRLEGLRGRTVLLNFWATWCPPCVEETPSLEALHRRLGPRGLLVLGVSVDETWAPVREFGSRFEVTFPIALDPQRATSRRYGTQKYPESYLIDGGGRIVRKYVGAVDWSRADVVAEIEGVLRGPGR